MNGRSTLDRLDELIAERSILLHPFYVAWQKGALTREQLARYATIYHPHVAAFPRYLSTAATRTEDPVVRSELERNLADELSVPKAHEELWLDFAEELGVDRAGLKDAAPHPAARQIVDAFDRLAASGDANAMAALYAYESQQPEVSREKAGGLRGLYGVDNPRALAYFDVHAEVDIEHRAGERKVIQWCLDAGADPDALLSAADQALTAYWGLLDGVCADAGIENRPH
ncbi:MAG: CADD family putative folate metabolism protein [Gemmatimonadales bacterium]